MNHICKDIFRAVHEGKWLSIEYKNGRQETTKYWIAIKNINIVKRSLLVDGLHLYQYTCKELYIYIDSIQSSSVIDGSFCETNQELIEDIRLNPEKYRSIFRHTANLKILNYLVDCSRLDATPYKSDYALIDKLDGDSFDGGACHLNPEQFKQVVDNFQIKAKNHDGQAKLRLKQIALNVLSIHAREGLYVLAYRKMNLDVKRRALVPDEEITICREFTINGKQQSIRRFLDADDYGLLEKFEQNQETIKDKLTKAGGQKVSVDDMPYLIAIGRDLLLDLNHEYAAILNMYEKEKVTAPLRAFFGDMVRQPVRRKNYPIALLNNKVNLDQLLAIHNGMKYPLTYIQGPPGTGKTNTIVNAVVTAFFNEKTVLFTSFNNHPIDGVCRTLQNIPYRDKGMIPFPIIRLGNNDKVDEALVYMRRLYERTKDIPIYDSTLKKNYGDKVERTRKLTELLEKHEEKLRLLEKKDSLEKLLETNRHLTFQVKLQGEQMAEVEGKLREIGEITDEEALGLLQGDEEAFLKYLYYTSAKYIKRLDDTKNQELLHIIYMENAQERVVRFNRYMAQEENVRRFLRIFPIVATTCISAHKIGEPEPYFDMVIMDEASQGNIATSLVPIIRGDNLMLVGDPQQLNPVILLDPKDNDKLRRMYSVMDEYDYIANSIYKTYLASDFISREILLSHHYRCHPRIIQFNNRKYYNNKLIIDSEASGEEPLRYIDIEENVSFYKNTAPAEAACILEYVRENRDKRIGIITPFANQKDYINSMLKENGIDDVLCGTVHAFQGDQKDIVLFSLALTDRTTVKTYDWLKNNKELINVATSRARNQLIVLSGKKQLDRLHREGTDDLYELVQYVKTNGISEVTPRTAASRALGIKPYSSETEAAFLENLNHALDNVLNTDKKCVVHKEVGISHVFCDSEGYKDLFYTGRFDFVVYELDYNKREIPILAIELDGREHLDDEAVRERDGKKNKICREHGFELIRIENCYARRYNYMKEILIRYFKGVKGR